MPPCRRPSPPCRRAPSLLAFLLALAAAAAAVPTQAAAQYFPSEFAVSSFTDTTCSSGVVPPKYRFAPNSTFQGFSCSVSFPRAALLALVGGGNSSGGSSSSSSSGSAAGTSGNGNNSSDIGENGVHESTTAAAVEANSTSGTNTTNADSTTLVSGAAEVSAAKSTTFFLSVGVFPTDFALPNQYVRSITIDGHELLTDGPCFPTGKCGGSRPFSCLVADVTPFVYPLLLVGAGDTKTGSVSNGSNSSSSSGTGGAASAGGQLNGTEILAKGMVTVTVTMSPAVTSPCHPCGGPSQLPCAVVQAGVRLIAASYFDTSMSATSSSATSENATQAGFEMSSIRGRSSRGRGSSALIPSAAPPPPPSSIPSPSSLSEVSQGTPSPTTTSSSAAGVISAFDLLANGTNGSAPGVALAFTSAPPVLANGSWGAFTWASAQRTADGSVKIPCSDCTFTCKIDGASPTSCPDGEEVVYSLPDGPHTFSVEAVLSGVGTANLSHAWLIDAQGPVPSLTVAPSRTQTALVALSVTFDKLCEGLKCDESSCDILLSPTMAARVDPSTFASDPSGLNYSVSIVPSANDTTAVTVELREGACRGSAGKPWTAGAQSSVEFLIDWNRPTCKTWCEVPTVVLPFFSQPRTAAHTANSTASCYLALSAPASPPPSDAAAAVTVTNGTASSLVQISSTLYSFLVTPTRQGPVEVQAQTEKMTDAVGNLFLSQEPFIFFYDATPPTVQLTTAREAGSGGGWVFPLLVAFSEPVYGFSASSLNVTNGAVTCLQGVDGGLGQFYEATVAAEAYGDVRIVVPAGVVTDIAGNANAASTAVTIGHYDVETAAGTGAWVVSGMLGWTVLASASVSFAVTVKESDPTSSPGIRIVSNRPFRAVSTPVVGADPSRNLLRMLMHVQVFALTSNLAVHMLPHFYRTFAYGLRWTYFYLPSPFSFAGWSSVSAQPYTVPGQDNSARPSCAPIYFNTVWNQSAYTAATQTAPPTVPISRFPAPPNDEQQQQQQQQQQEEEEQQQQKLQRGLKAKQLLQQNGYLPVRVAEEDMQQQQQQQLPLHQKHHIMMRHTSEPLSPNSLLNPSPEFLSSDFLPPPPPIPPPHLPPPPQPSLSAYSASPTRPNTAMVPTTHHHVGHSSGSSSSFPSFHFSSRASTDSRAPSLSVQGRRLLSHDLRSDKGMEKRGRSLGRASSLSSSSSSSPPPPPPPLEQVSHRMKARVEEVWPALRALGVDAEVVRSGDAEVHDGVMYHSHGHADGATAGVVPIGGHHDGPHEPSPQSPLLSHHQDLQNEHPHYMKLHGHDHDTGRHRGRGRGHGQGHGRGHGGHAGHDNADGRAAAAAADAVRRDLNAEVHAAANGVMRVEGDAEQSNSTGTPLYSSSSLTSSSSSSYIVYFTTSAPDALPPLSIDEYFYMLSWGAAFYTNYPDLSRDQHGFDQFVAVLFWFVIVFVAFTLGQLAMQYAWRAWRKQFLYGVFDPPRLQFLLLTLSLIGISWVCSGLIRGSSETGGSAAGLAVGVLFLYLWPFLFVLFGFILVWYIVVQEQFARFFVREMTEPRNESCLPTVARRFWSMLRQKRLKGHWVTITPSQKHILPRFGIFFEDYIVWGAQDVLGMMRDRMRAVYGSVDCFRMLLMGVVYGAWPATSNSWLQSVLLLLLAAAQFAYLVLLQPFTERGLQVVEAGSALSEVALFACAWVLAANPSASSMFAQTLAWVMLCFAALAWTAQLFNHWMALGHQINKLLNPPDEGKSPSQRSESDELTEEEEADEGEFDDDLLDDDDDISLSELEPTPPPPHLRHQQR